QFAAGMFAAPAVFRIRHDAGAAQATRGVGCRAGTGPRRTGAGAAAVVTHAAVLRVRRQVGAAVAAQRFPGGTTRTDVATRAELTHLAREAGRPASAAVVVVAHWVDA